MAIETTPEEFINRYRDGKIENIQTYSNVGYQDHPSIEDLDNISELFSGDFGLKELASSTIYSATEVVDDNIMNFVNDVSGLFSKDGKNKIINEKINYKENENGIKTSNDLLYNIRNNINIKKSIKSNINKNTPYNSISNFAGLAAVTMVGALGRTPTQEIWDKLNDGKNIYENIMNVTDFIMGSPRLTSQLSEVDILDQDEIIELNTATFNNFFSKKPGIKTGIGKDAPTRNHKIINEIENARLRAANGRNFYLGELIVEPYYNGYETGIGEDKVAKTDFVSFNIPFQFNANITEGSLEAKYDETEVMNRILPIRTWINTNSSPLTLETTYVALAPDNAGIKSDAEVYNYQTDSWMFDWTESRINEIELKLRSLVLPNLNNGRFVRPPIVKIKMSKAKIPNTLMDLYSYPELNENDLKITIGLDGDSSASSLKRYVVTSLQISPLEDYANSFGYVNTVNGEGLKRRGFKVSMSLSEVTKNFLDLVPDFRTYYDAWHKQEEIDLEFNSDYKNVLENKVKNLSEDGEIKNEVSNFINISKELLEEIKNGEFDYFLIKEKIFDKIKNQKFTNYKLNEKYEDIGLLRYDLDACFETNNIFADYQIFFEKEVKKLNTNVDFEWFKEKFFNDDEFLATYYYLEDKIKKLKIKIDDEYVELDKSNNPKIREYASLFSNCSAILQKIVNKKDVELQELCKTVEGFFDKINDERYDRIIKKYNYNYYENNAIIEFRQVENTKHYVLHVLDLLEVGAAEYNFICQAFGLWTGVGYVLDGTSDIYNNLIKNDNKNAYILKRIITEQNTVKQCKKIKL